MNSGSFLINSDFQSSIEHPSRVQNELVMLQDGLKFLVLVKFTEKFSCTGSFRKSSEEILKKF